MSGADAARFEAWLAKALDERGLDGQTFAEYGVALFSARYTMMAHIPQSRRMFWCSERCMSFHVV